MKNLPVADMRQGPEARDGMTAIPKVSDRVNVKGRRGLFTVVSVEANGVHVMALEGAPRLITVPLDDIEPEQEMNARGHRDEQGSV
jgi:hypothetical protein